MKLSRKFNRALLFVAISVFAFFFMFSFLRQSSHFTFAEGEDGFVSYEGAKFVSFYDGGDKLTIKTEASTVRDALDRAGIIINAGDKVEPGLDVEINADNFHVNIYRARPVIVKDGSVDKYLMTASYDAKTIVKETGLVVYDGDIVLGGGTIVRQ